MRHCQSQFVGRRSDEAADGLWCIVVLENTFCPWSVRMIRTPVFLNDGTQAVKLPKAVGLDDDVRDVTVTVVGRARVIAPVGESWDSWFIGPGMTHDFMTERDQPAVYERQSI